jgi:hypothetical protein
MIATHATISVATNDESYGTTGRVGTHSEPSDHSAPCKILLPPRPGQSRFAPPQYYYPASRSGVVPSTMLAA